MNDYTFRKKLNDMGADAKRKIDAFFGDATDNAHEFVEKFKTMSNKTRLRVAKSVGAGLMSLLILCGFTGCMDDLGNILNAQGPQNTQASTTIQYNYPQETTRTPQENSTPAETTQKPQETTKPEETSKPAETTQKPQDSSTPEETTTQKPAETTTPGGTVTVPGEDLPADEDGYAYAAFFANLVKDTISNSVIFNSEDAKYRNVLKSQTPEIVFVIRGENTSKEKTPIVIYAKYKLNSSENIYVRMSYGIKSIDYTKLGYSQLYSSYESYVQAMQKALESKAELAKADVSVLYENQDAINNQIGAGFASALGENFVDASINSVRRGIGEESDDAEISGFAYDKEGKSYVYVLNCHTKSRAETSSNIILGLENGTLNPDTDFNSFEVTVAPVAGVFVQQENEAE